MSALEFAFSGRLGAFAIDAAFTAPASGVTGLFGPSGCGKTTVLRAIAGLHRFAQGRCIVGGEIWQDDARFVPPHERPIGYVFQEASLFPHLSVRRNLLYGAPRDGGKGVAFDEIVALLGLDRLIDRKPDRLSGGERQRVAIGRALMSAPKVLLMDEPVSALDAQTKDEILPFLDRLHQSLKLPILYVTHDRAEIERLADHLVLMQAGRVVSAGPLRQLQADPASPHAQAPRAAVSLDAEVVACDPAYGLATLAVPGGLFRVTAPDVQVGERRRLNIHASDVSIALQAPEQSSVLNVLPAQVLGAQASSGFDMLVALRLGDEGATLLSRISKYSWDALRLSVGAKVFAQVKGVALEPVGLQPRMQLTARR
jgi:molybdate transport system ATP-binding protein